MSDMFEDFIKIYSGDNGDFSINYRGNYYSLCSIYDHEGDTILCENLTISEGLKKLRELNNKTDIKGRYVLLVAEDPKVDIPF